MQQDEYTGVGGSYVIVDGKRVPADPETGLPLPADSRGALPAPTPLPQE